MISVVDMGITYFYHLDKALFMSFEKGYVRLSFSNFVDYFKISPTHRFYTPTVSFLYTE